MQKSRWIIPSAAIAGMMGFGHAGCYTSGIPGGNGFGGTTSSGGSSASVGGSTTGGIDNDADTDAAAVRECENSLNCDGEDRNVCETDAGQCVQCAKHDDCIGRSEAFCDANKCVSCTATLGCDSTTQRCVNSECISKTNCSSDVTCAHLQPRQICGAGYCVECTAAVLCKDFNLVKCGGDSPCTCQNGLCFDSLGVRVTPAEVALPADAGLP